MRLGTASPVLASAFFAAAAAQGAEVHETGVQTKPIGQSLALRGQVLSAQKDGEARFAITSVTWGQKISLLGAHHVAIIFDGKASPDRECPYYPGRESDIADAGRTFIVTTSASAGEIERVIEAGCMITERPELSKIRKALPEEIPDFSLR